MNIICLYCTDSWLSCTQKESGKTCHAASPSGIWSLALVFETSLSKSLDLVLSISNRYNSLETFKPLLILTDCLVENRGTTDLKLDVISGALRPM